MKNPLDRRTARGYGNVVPGPAANRDPKVTIMRAALTKATARYNLGGRPRNDPPKKPTLAKLKFMDGDD